MASVVSSKSLAALVSAAAALASVSEAAVAVFHKVSVAKDWHEANQFCEDKYGTVLVGITSPAENAEFQSLKTNVYSGISFFGLNDIEVNGVWINVGGESSLLYSNWYPGQPTNWHPANEDCGDFLPDGRWADGKCSNKWAGFFCRAPAWLPASTIGGDDWVLVHGVGSKNWLQAQAYCANVKQGSKLASVHSAAQNAAMYNAMNNRGKENVWIGLNDFAVEGTWVWSDGSPVDYTNWWPGEPSQNHAGVDCAAIWAAGEWDDKGCDSVYDAFFCKL